MEKIAIELSKIKTANELRFLDLQTFETKCRSQQGNTLLFWQEKKIKTELAPIRDIKRLLDIVEELQTKVFESPKRESVQKMIQDLDKEIEQMKSNYINTAFEKFKSRQDVVKIMESKGDFRNNILDNIEKGINDFNEKNQGVIITSFEYQEQIKCFWEKLYSCLNLYRKLKYAK